MAKAQRVFVMTFENKHGTNVSVHRTFEGAQEALGKYVRNWYEHEFVDWPDTLSEIKRLLVAKDYEGAADAYCDGLGYEESWDIVSAEMED